MSVIPVACLYGLVLFALIYWYVKWEMNNKLKKQRNKFLFRIKKNGK